MKSIKKKYLKKFYKTYNICESINLKQNHFLPKKINIIDSFIKSIIKYIVNEDFKELKLKRNDDYINKCII